MKESSSPYLLLFFILVISFLISCLSSLEKSSTLDESKHLRYGYSLLDGDVTRRSDSKVPLSIISAASYEYLSSSPIFEDHRLLAGRLPTIFFQLGLILLTFFWGRSLYGNAAGILSAILVAIDPNLIAHSRWITTDLFATFFICLSVFTFGRFLKNPSILNSIVSAIILGLAQHAKFNAVFLYPIFILFGVFYIFASRKFKLSLHIPLFAVISLLIINGGYLFDGTGTPLKEYSFKSDTFQELSRKFESINSVPIPLPKPFLEGLDWTHHNDLTGEARGKPYLLGQLLERGERFPLYYPVVFLFKIPIGIQLLLLLSLIYFIARRKESQFKVESSLLLFSVTFYTVYLVFFSNAQMGIRMSLMIFPMLYVLVGSLTPLCSKSRLSKVIVISLVTYSLISSLSYYPHYLSYFNEFSLDKRLTYRITADSNLDWSQNRKLVRRYLKERPFVVRNPSSPQVGTIIVSANFLTGVVGGKRYKWLVELGKEETPIAHLGYSEFIFRVDEEID